MKNESMEKRIGKSCGFQSFGRYYEMPNKKIGYIEGLKKLLIEIKTKKNE